MQKSSPPANSPTKFGCLSQDTQLSQKLRRIIFCEYLYIPRGHIRVQDVSWIFNIFSAQKMGPPMFGAFYNDQKTPQTRHVTSDTVTRDRDSLFSPHRNVQKKGNNRPFGRDSATKGSAISKGLPTRCAVPHIYSELGLFGRQLLCGSKHRKDPSNV
jgi:hypothetical protein